MTRTSRFKVAPCRLTLEALERRDLPSGYPPTAAEQLFLEELNDARANPAAYGQSIGLDLSGVAPSQPLAFNTILVQTARDHSQDMNNRAYFAHNTPEGLDPGQRMTNAGFNWNAWGESIAAGYATPADALKGLIIDAGVSNLGHRKMLLAIDPVFRGQNQVGVGIVQNGGGPYANYYTIDMGSTAAAPVFVTGVVFNDLNHNGKYDAGEGLGGVTVSASGGAQTTTFGSGGYTLQLTPGAYTITAFGGGLAGSISQAVTIGAANVRLNFTAGSGSYQLPLVGPVIATGADAGGGPDVRVYNARTSALEFELFPYDPHFTGGVRVTVADVTGDSVPDIITAPGPTGGPDIRIFDGATGALVREFMAYDPHFTGGVFVAAADLNGDGKAEIITSPDAGGGPDVRVFDGATGALTREIFAYDPHFLGGVRVAVGDINGDHVPDIITGPGATGGPDVRVFSGSTGALIREFFAYDPRFMGGVYVAAGDVNGDGQADIVTGAGAGGGPDVRVFSGATGALLSDRMAYSSGFTGGVRVGVADVNGDGRMDIITGAGPGGGPHTEAFDGTSGAVLDSFFAYDPNFLGGIFVGGQ